MGRLDTLPADQRAVVGLLLRQGKSYDELSGLVNLDAVTVRDRAHAALDALGPHEGNGLDPERRAELADFLLGQGSEADREAARVFLAGSGPGRTWARAVSAELAPVAGDALPEVPPDPPAPPASPSAPRVSRRGGAFLLGALAVVAALAVAGALIFGHSSSGDEGGGGSGAGTTTTPTGTTTAPSAAAARAKVRAQANMTAPAGAPAPRAVGVVQVVDAKGRRQLLAIVQGLPRPGRGEGFGIWLTAPNGRRSWLGFFQSADKQGRLIAQGVLRHPITGFDAMLVTRETHAAPKAPGRVYLQGRIQRPAAGSGG